MIDFELVLRTVRGTFQTIPHDGDVFVASGRHGNRVLVPGCCHSRWHQVGSCEWHCEWMGIPYEQRITVVGVAAEIKQLDELQNDGSSPTVNTGSRASGFCNPTQTKE